MGAKQGQLLTGKVLMVANAKQSYDLTFECKIEGTNTISTNTLDLKNPYFRYTGVTPAPPPGNTHSSPSEDYWAQMDLAGARQAVNLVNGVIVDGLGHVSLDSGPPSHAHQQPNIHQGSIPATGRREKANSSSPAPPTSSATSLPFNQLIGGAVSPSLLNTTTNQPLNYATNSSQAQAGGAQSQAYPVIGDYAMIANNLRNLT